jgi:hypothetical protein
MGFRSDMKEALASSFPDADATAKKLVAEANEHKWRYVVVKFAGAAVGHQPPGDMRIINAIASLGWKLISATKHGLYFERES